MKNKTLKKILCFLLALVVMVSTPLNLQASALAIEPWVIWAIVTYLTSVGLVFTATGGAQAVYDAVEKKVNQYGNNVIDFYDIVRQNMKIVKPPSPPPNWNPDFGNLFITAVGVEALGRFAEWLTSEGGWSLGSNVSDGYEFATFDIIYNDGNGYGDPIPSATCLIEEWEKSPQSSYYRAKLTLEGSSYIVTTEKKFKTVLSGSSTTYSYFYYDTGMTNQYYISNILNNSLQNRVYVSPASLVYNFSLPITAQEFYENAQIGFVFYNELIYAGAIYDGYFYRIGSLTNTTFQKSVLSADIEIPTELPEIKPLPTLEGLLLESEALASDSLEALGNVVETYFNDAGTIPAPQPNIIPDPEAAPDPTPVPTPAPSPEIEDVGDLGLPTLGEAIFSKFPFSLPKDLKRISDILNAEPVPPKWEVDLYGTLGERIPFSGETKLTIDLEEYEELGQISRWTSVISFVVFLIIITKGVIRW